MMITGYVDPPTTLVADSWAELFFCCLMGAVVLAALGYAVAKREWVLAVLIPAAGVSSLIEPFYDYVGGAWWATNLTTAFTSFDGRLFDPYFFPLGYACWVGIGAYVAYRIFAKRPAKSRILAGFAVLAVAESVLELPWIHTSLFSYYGPQPYTLFGYSLVWCAINTSGLAFTGSLLLVMRPALPGWGAVRAAVVPFLNIGWYFACAWPTWLAYQAGAPVPVLWAAGTLTIAIAVTQIYLLAGYISGSAPYGLTGSTSAGASGSNSPYSSTSSTCSTALSTSSSPGPTSRSAAQGGA
jgi:hypothetical protein